jgi:uncharacterized protein (TIGR03083 family)
MDALRRLVDVWRSSCADFAELARSLSDDEWRLPTDLQGWSVGDIVAHGASVEAELAGDEPLRVTIDKQAPHIRDAAGIYTERGVVARRERSREEVVAEFEHAVERRTALLAAEQLDDPEGQPPITPGRVVWNWQTLLRNRAVDVWMHEQDIRRAVGRPGGLDTAGAVHTQGVFAAALPFVVAKKAGAPPGTTVTFDLTGPVPAVYVVEVDANGRGRAIDPSPERPTLRFTLDTESFTILGGGRRDPDNLPIRVEGDGTAEPTLSTQILASLNLTL